MAKVLIVSVVYPPDIVSTANIVQGLATSLAGFGHDVGVLSAVPHYNPDGSDGAQRWRPTGASLEHGLRVVRCFVPRRVPSIAHRLAGLAILHLTMTIGALRHFRDREVAIVVSPPLTLSLIGLLLRAISGTKFIYNAQELWPDVPRDLGVVRSRMLIGGLEMFERMVYRRADHVVPIGEMFSEIVCQRGADPAKTTAIPNSVDTGWIGPRPKDNPLARDWSLDDKPVVLYAGNLGLTQDFNLVLGAAKAMPATQFVIVGGGAAHGAVRNSVNEACLDNVRLYDFLNRERVPDLYGLADVVIVPLKAPHDRTTTPSKIFSAMAAQKPVVATADPDTDLARTIGVARAGLCVPHGQIAELVVAIGALLEGQAGPSWDPDTAVRFADAHSPARIGRRYDDVVQTTLQATVTPNSTSI